MRALKKCGSHPWIGMIPWNRKWQPAPVFLPGKFHGQRSLADYHPWGHKELDTTEHTHTHTHWNQISNCQHLSDHRKRKRIPKNICFCFIDYTKAFDYMDREKLWKILKEMGIPNHFTCLLMNLHVSQEAIVRTGHGAGSKLGKGYEKSVYCHPAYLTYMQNILCKMLGWMNHKLESKLLGEISSISDVWTIQLEW